VIVHILPVSSRRLFPSSLFLPNDAPKVPPAKKYRRLHDAEASITPWPLIITILIQVPKRDLAASDHKHVLASLYQSIFRLRIDIDSFTTPSKWIYFMSLFSNDASAHSN
jgi:hypothetical protein